MNRFTKGILFLGIAPILLASAFMSRKPDIEKACQRIKTRQLAVEKQVRLTVLGAERESTEAGGTALQPLKPYC